MTDNGVLERDFLGRDHFINRPIGTFIPTMGIPERDSLGRDAA
ncbi:hypothetical protein COLO4_05635 [Corchorus olitorius]|uniref:Uncharacterized protein n=1 Tax=Corchorus olitorius TaxID=93759 RepID=A0A1R3KQA6_9ROSI|nr:hypothetical protein COLO4_05635 [Corchorus olitorius]